MRKANTSIVVFAAVLAFAAVASAPALAESWFVNGTKLAKGATVAVATTAQVDESPFINVPSLGVRITCSGSTIQQNGAYIQGEAGGGAQSLTLSSCSEISPTTCKIGSTLVIEDFYLLVHIEKSIFGITVLLWHAVEEGRRIIGLIEFKGTCAEAGEQPLDGSAALGMRGAENETVTKADEGLGTTENNSLEIFKSKAYIVGGKALLKLASGQSWSFH